VVVLGGGIAGLTAAHELAERGFEVVVLERRIAAGGKARSLYGAPAALGPGSEQYLESTTPWAPGEHGFRFFPGFYKHVPDTMRRIPAGEGRTVADGLVATTRVGITQYDRPMFELPAQFPRTPSDAVTVLSDLLVAFSPVTGLTPDDLAFFAGRIWQVLTSCPERRLAEYEGISWWEFIDAERRPGAYQKFLAQGQTRSLVAAQARKASARTVGDMFIQLALDAFDPQAGALDRVLDGPTTDVWLEPWRRWIESLGAEYRTGVEVRQIRCDGGRITGVVAEGGGRTEVIEGDYYIDALPVERTAALITPEIVAADPSLSTLPALAANVEWMNGIQFYLFRDVPMLHGHVIHMDSQWALTSISQVQFWGPRWVDSYIGDVEFNGIVSVDVSDWNAPGLGGRPAVECSPAEVAAEVWEQLKRSLAGTGVEGLEDANLAGWFLDPDIAPDATAAGRLANLEPLLVNYVDTWRLRPEAVTAIPNFFLAADYVRTHTDLATMEAANEAARRAVNGVLDAEGHPASRCGVWPLEEPAVFQPWRQYDAARFRLGLPWDRTLLDLGAAALAAADPVLAAVPEVMARVEPVSAVVASVGGALDELDRAVPLLRPEATVDRLAEKVYGGAAPLPTTLPLEASPEADPDGDPESGPGGFVERLAWYRDRALEVVVEAVPRHEPGRYLYDLVRDFVAQPSKGLRPGLCLATCRAYGGTTDDALPAAAGLEMLHNAFLVHDDIEDASAERRGQPTMHQRVGVPLAVNAGDAMNALSMRLFRRNLDRLCPDTGLRLIDEVDHLLLESLEGQAVELGWIRDHACDVTTDDYLRLVLKKTAWYSFIHPMRIGALIAGADDDLERFHRFGFLLGAAFQIQDDVLNLIGSASRYGKEIGGDLSEGKRTLVLAHALGQATPADRARLEDFLGRPGQRRLEREIAGIYELLTRTGSVQWARRAAAALSVAAGNELPVAFAGARDGPDLDFVRSLVEYVTGRDV
jgi:geranylgeranyl pyrophosphate synthase/uncharacterized protein with NAD-binding domain and iron-sulfur cluster